MQKIIFDKLITHGWIIRYMISPYLKVELVSNVFAKNMSLAIRMRSLGNELIKILPKELNQRYLHRFQTGTKIF